MQTVTYHAEGVIDFAWTASPHFQEARRQVNGVEILYLYLPEHGWTVNRVLEAAEAAITHYSNWYGPYAYPRLTIVDAPDEGEGAGGMEYPTLVTAGAMDLFGLGPGFLQLGLDRSIELVVMHEVGHQWWQSMVAFNEAEEPWLDEGFTDYSTVRLSEVVYGAGRSALEAGNLEVSYLDLRRGEYLMFPALPMYGRAWEFPGLVDYGVATYSKPAVSLTTLERFLGEELMLEILSTFFQRYRFTHPTTEDFRSVAAQVAGQDLSWFFDGLVYGEGVLNYSVSEVNAYSLTVSRQGTLAIPVEVQVDFVDGSQVLEQWNGAEPEKTFDYNGGPAVQSAVIDPRRKIVVDLVWSDNGLRRRRDLQSWLALSSRVLYRIQDFLLMLGGL
jgi:aminopeptidase N